MVKMAAVEPVCFYPNREHVEEFNHRKLNMKKLSDYLYQEKINENEEKIKTNENDVLFKVQQPYYLPEYYHSTFVNEMPLIDILPAKRIHETTKQYKQYETLHYEEPTWTKAEKELFNILYNTIGKNFHKMAKEFENKATTILIPSAILKQSKVNITKETEKDIIAAVTPISSDSESNNKEDNYEKTKKRKHNKDTEDKRQSKKNKTEKDDGFNCHALPSQYNKTIHLLVHNVNNQQEIQKEDMIFPRTTSEIIHYYYKNKFNIPNWKIHKEVKTNLKKNKKSATK